MKFVNLEHIHNYICLDLNPGATNPTLYKENLKRDKVKFVRANAESIPFPDDYFDLSTSLCVLAHVENPNLTFQELLRVTRSGGRIVITMPCDPGILNRAVKAIVTYPKMKKLRIRKPKLLNAYEHRNSIHHLLQFADEVFGECKVRRKYLPFFFPSWNFNLFITYVIDV